MGDAVRFTQRTGDAPFVIDVDYLARRSPDETIERAGVAMRFKSVCYPLQDYARAFEDADLVIQALREPSVREEDVER
jgi:hypothetical protein